MKSKTKYFDFIIIFKLNLKAPNKIPGWLSVEFVDNLKNLKNFAFEYL